MIILGPPSFPRVPVSGASNVTLDQSRTVLQASAGYGAGTYTQTLAVQLAIPPRSRAGSYISTLTLTMSAAP